MSDALPPPKDKVMGYIVTGAAGAYMVSRSYGPNVLAYGPQVATVFRTRQQDRRAIAASVAYAKRERLPWPNDYRIWRLQKREI